MHLKILLPLGTFADKSDVLSITAETGAGSFELLPHRLDCVAALVPGLLAYRLASQGTAYIAVDAGLLVKSGDDVVICARRAVGGVDLAALHDAVMRDFLTVDSQEKSVRTALSKMQGALLRHFTGLQRDR